MLTGTDQVICVVKVPKKKTWTVEVISSQMDRVLEYDAICHNIAASAKDGADLFFVCRRLAEQLCCSVLGTQRNQSGEEELMCDYSATDDVNPDKD